MDELRDWARALPDDATAEIARRLPCRTDRGTMAAVCRTWRARAQVPDRPPALPWLLMPTADSTRVHCFLSDYHVHHRINAPPHGARYFGSHDGAWLILAYDRTHNHVLPNLHVLLNLHDDRTRDLPDLVRNGNVFHEMAILAATLSAPPDDPNCVGACIFTSWPPNNLDLRRFAFWRMGSVMASDFMPDPEPGWPAPADLEVEDVVFHGDAFRFLTQGEHIFVYQPAFDEHMALVPQLNVNLFEPGGRNYDGLLVHARYLVASGLGELLMVVRFTNPQLMTSSFRVFRAIPPAQMLQADGNDDGEDDQDGEEDDGDQEVGDQDAEEVEDQGEEVGDQDAEEVGDQGEEVSDQDEEEVGDQGEEVSDQDEEEVGDQGEEVEDQGGEEEDLVEEDEYPWSWGELDTLNGRMLFVGRGCSRSYNVAQYPGFKAGVYFLDDRSFYDEEMMLLDVNERQYPCHDNGKWLEGPPPVVMRCPPQNPSNHSPLAWLLP